MLNESNSYISKKATGDTYLYYLEEHDKVVKLLSDQFPKLCAAVQEEVDLYGDKYWLGRFALLVMQKYESIQSEPCTYRAMSLLCKLVDDTEKNSSKNYLELINLIKAISKFWD